MDIPRTILWLIFNIALPVAFVLLLIRFCLRKLFALYFRQKCAACADTAHHLLTYPEGSLHHAYGKPAQAMSELYYALAEAFGGANTEALIMKAPSGYAESLYLAIVNQSVLRLDVLRGQPLRLEFTDLPFLFEAIGKFYMADLEMRQHSDWTIDGWPEKVIEKLGK